ncbi:MAG: hypothetical protein A2Y24_06630 [Clostridiales bacterium GWE2_32_10]|nr:MAG: hypothetical protein A2Y24_06630 [Clostridiales bacterium GWE2_32_10]HBY20406.1 DUF402 domain-containing protein [Clostridiales bacterium]
MQSVKLLRKRYIPNETVDISGDEVIYVDEELLVSRWVPIHNREDIKYGISYLYINKGFKVAKVYNYNNELDHYYCDIMQVERDKFTNTYTEIDLLVDIVVYRNGEVRVLDLDELSEARQKKLITEEQLLYALEHANKLLNIIYNGGLENLLTENK